MLRGTDCDSPLPNIRCTMCSFDFAGSGLSDGEYVSLGYYEREDLAVVIEYLQKKRNMGPVAIWGRSMGSATALMYLVLL